MHEHVQDLYSVSLTWVLFPNVCGYYTLNIPSTKRADIECMYILSSKTNFIQSEGAVYVLAQYINSVTSLTCMWLTQLQAHYDEESIG